MIYNLFVMKRSNVIDRRGTHNFTIGTIAAIEAVLGEPILRVCDGDHTSGN